MNCHQLSYHQLSLNNKYHTFYFLKICQLQYIGSIGIKPPIMASYALPKSHQDVIISQLAVKMSDELILLQLVEKPLVDIDPEIADLMVCLPHILTLTSWNLSRILLEKRNPTATRVNCSYCLGKFYFSCGI